jgi:hypothetical protein
VPDGNGGVKAEAVPVTGVLHTPEGRPTPIRIDAAGNYIASTPEQLLILSQLQGEGPERPSMDKVFVQASIAAQLAKADKQPEGLSPAEAARDTAARSS